MTGNAPTHTCSYFCDKPECIKAQRDELRDKLAAIESQPVPVEPERVKAMRSDTWCGGDVSEALRYIDSLQSALQRLAEEIKSERECRNAAARAYEKAESINRRMVELMKEPSEGMLDAACDIDGHARLAQGKDEGASYADMFKAMSAELLKEVEK